MLNRLGILAMTVGGALAFASVQPVQAQSPSSQDLLKTCLSCHGPGGISTLPSRPSIAGQRGDYVARQLTSFLQAAEFHKANRIQDTDDDAVGTADPRGSSLRVDPIMEHMVTGLDATQVVKISAAIAALPCRLDKMVIKSPPPTPPSISKSCAMCHGVDGVGDQHDVPILAGQQRAYLRRQLLLLRESAWGAPPREGDISRSHPIMESETARLKIQDVDILAKYYSALDCRGRADN